jgi:hypothetical protein
MQGSSDMVRRHGFWNSENVAYELWLLRLVIGNGQLEIGCWLLSRCTPTMQAAADTGVDGSGR